MVQKESMNSTLNDVLDKSLTGREKSIFPGVFVFLYTWLATNKQYSPWHPPNYTDNGIKMLINIYTFKNCRRLSIYVDGF